MKMTKRKAVAALAAMTLAARAQTEPAAQDTGSHPLPAAAPGATGLGRFFKSQTYHFQTLRALSDVPFGGADTGEVLETIKTIKDGDAQGWYAAWTKTGDRVLALAQETQDPLSKGGAYMRAHNYFRTAEFLLPPDDAKRPASWERNIGCFYKALDTLGVAHERFRAPYPGGGLQAIYYPGPAGAASKPLIMFVGGYDSTLEELYLVLVKAAHDRGYAVLTYEGPGQGEALRKQGLHFLPEWEKPNGAVLDAFLHTYAKPVKTILVGMSMGGYLAPRAAAFDDRIDGVVAFDTFFDIGEIADGIVKMAANPQARSSPDFIWAMDNARWTMGTADLESTRQAFQAYKLAPVAARIRQPVLILAGAEDHFVPYHQTADFEKSLVNAKSVTTRIFDRASGGAEHCQLGAATLWHAAFFDWLRKTFA